MMYVKPVIYSTPKINVAGMGGTEKAQYSVGFCGDSLVVYASAGSTALTAGVAIGVAVAS